MITNIVVHLWSLSRGPFVVLSGPFVVVSGPFVVDSGPFMVLSSPFVERAPVVRAI